MWGWGWDPGCLHVSQALGQKHAISRPYLFNLAAYKSMATNLDNAGQGPSYPCFGEDKLGAESGQALLGLPAFLPHHPSLPLKTAVSVLGLQHLPPWPNSLSFLCLEFSFHSFHGRVFLFHVSVTTLTIQRDLP